MHKQFYEKNLVHNLIWYTLDKHAVTKCPHIPPFSVTSFVRKCYAITKERIKFKKVEIIAILDEIILSANPITTFTLICDETFLSISSGQFIALMVIGNEVARHYYKEHNLVKVEEVINIMQTRMLALHNQNVKRLCLHIIGIVVGLLCGVYLCLII